MLVATTFHALPNRTTGDLVEHDHHVRLFADPSTNRLELELAARRHRMRTATLCAEGVA